MVTSKQDEPDIKSVEHLLGYFDMQVLAAYRNEPDKYVIESDFFEGELRTTKEYYRELENAGRENEYISVRFGYRTLEDGNLAVVAWLPDLSKRSQAHVQKWAAFHLEDPQWTTDYDERFVLWARRYLEGSWDVDNGPSYYLGETIRIVNGLTSELVGTSLYRHEPSGTMNFPAAQNTHRYQDAHKELYGYLVDGLDKDCISRLASLLGKDIKVGDKTTVQAILKLLPDLETATNFKSAVSLVGGQRRLASHGVRQPAARFPAFEQFTKDLALCLEGVKELLTALEQTFGISGKRAYERHEAKKLLPRIARPAEPHYSICQTSRMEGRTVEKVEYGFRHDIENVHQSEVLVIHFTDGSIMSIETGSNAANLANDENSLRPEDFHVDFMVHWVPSLRADDSKP